MVEVAAIGALLGGAASVYTATKGGGKADHPVPQTIEPRARASDTAKKLRTDQGRRMAALRANIERNLGTEQLGKATLLGA